MKKHAPLRVVGPTILVLVSVFLFTAGLHPQGHTYPSSRAEKDRVLKQLLRRESRNQARFPESATSR